MCIVSVSVKYGWSTSATAMATENEDSALLIMALCVFSFPRILL